MGDETETPFTVQLVACVAGNPLKAWEGSTGLDDTEHVPDDEWQDQTHDFATLDEAKAFVAGLDGRVATHVQITHDGTVLFDQDAAHDLEAAHVPTVEELEAEAAAAAPPPPPPTPLPAQ